MKNKKATYLLLPVVLIIWGIILYRIFHVVNDDNTVQRSFATMEVSLPNVEKDTFDLLLNYRDPFMLKAVAPANDNNSVEKPKVSKPAPILKPETPILWPSISYGGLIKNQEGNKQLAFVQINGQASIMKQGDIVGDVLLNKVWKDSIEVKYSGSSKIVHK